MNRFTPSWQDWTPKKGTPQGAKSDKRTLGTFGTSMGRYFQENEGENPSQKTPASRSAKSDKKAVHAVLLQRPDSVPDGWVQGVADLLVMPPHPGWSEEGWKVLQHDASTFLRGGWAAHAHLLGWDAPNLFSVHATAPHARLDGMGLIPLLGGWPVIALTEESAAIKASSGTQSFRRRQSWPSDCGLIWEL